MDIHTCTHTQTGDSHEMYIQSYKYKNDKPHNQTHDYFRKKKEEKGMQSFRFLDPISMCVYVCLGDQEGGGSSHRSHLTDKQFLITSRVCENSAQF